MVDRLVDRSVVRSVMGGPLRPTGLANLGAPRKAQFGRLVDIQRNPRRDARGIAPNRGQQPGRSGLALPFIRRPYGLAASDVARPGASHRVRRAADNRGPAPRQPVPPRSPDR